MIAEWNGIVLKNNASVNLSIGNIIQVINIIRIDNEPVTPYNVVIIVDNVVLT